MGVGGSCVWVWGEGGGGGGVSWVKIGQKVDYIICEFALFNNILWCPKICANEASSGQNWQFFIVQNLLNILWQASAWFDNLVNCCKWECKID